MKVLVTGANGFIGSNLCSRATGSRPRAVTWGSRARRSGTNWAGSRRWDLNRG